jgi:hypothetical protein
MRKLFLLLILVLTLAGCSSPTPEPTATPIPPTPTPEPPKALELFMEKEDMTLEQAQEAIDVLNQVGIEDIQRLDYLKDDPPGKLYVTNYGHFEEIRIYVSNDKTIKRVLDEINDISFWSDLNGGFVRKVTDFFIDEDEKKPFIQIALDFVPRGLKAPSTAQFPDVTSNDWKVSRYGKYVEVESWVDAQNSFGALIRSDILMQIHYETKEVLYLSIGGEHVFGERVHWRRY